MHSPSDAMYVFSGSANPQLAGAICAYLRKHLESMQLGSVYLGRFPDGECDVRIRENVRGSDVFVIQPTCPPVNENLMELLVVIDALRRASAQRITAVMPYYGYARKDRKDEARVPITAKLVAELLAKAGADRVLTLDLHAAQIQGFFDIPVDHLYAAPVLVKYIGGLGLTNLAVVCSDVGGIKTARSYAKKLGAELAIVDKRRVDASETEALNLIGDIRDRNVVLVDDMIATGSSIAGAATFLKKQGAREVRVAASHAVFCGEAGRVLGEAGLREVVVTDSIPLEGRCGLENLTVLSVAGLLGEAIWRIHTNQSVSSLF